MTSSAGQAGTPHPGRGPVELAVIDALDPARLLVRLPRRTSLGHRRRGQVQHHHMARSHNPATTARGSDKRRDRFRGPVALMWGKNRRYRHMLGIERAPQQLSSGTPIHRGTSMYGPSMGNWMLLGAGSCRCRLARIIPVVCAPTRPSRVGAAFTTGTAR